MFYFSAYYYREIDEAMESRAAAAKARRLAAARAEKKHRSSSSEVSLESMEVKVAEKPDFLTRCYRSFREKWIKFLFKYSFKKNSTVPPLGEQKNNILKNQNYKPKDVITREPEVLSPSTETIYTMAEVHATQSGSPNFLRKTQAGQMSSFKKPSLLDLKEKKKAEKINRAQESKISFFKSAENLDIHSVLEMWHASDRSFKSCGSISSDSSGSSLSK